MNTNLTNSDIKAAAALVASRFRILGQTMDGKEAHRIAVHEVADAIGIEDDELRMHIGKWSNSFKTPRAKKSTRVDTEYFSKLFSETKQKEMYIPQVKISVEDPFLADELVPRLIEKFRSLHPNQVGMQVYASSKDAKYARGLMSRVASKLRWGKYKTHVSGCVLYAKYQCPDNKEYERY